MSKTILILCEYGSSKELGMVSRPMKIARELSKSNKVTIVASAFSHTRNKQPSYDCILEENIEYKMMGGNIGKSILPWAPKPIRSTIFCIYATIYTLREVRKIDILINSIPSHLQIITGAAIKFINPQIIYITDLRDIWSANIRGRAEGTSLTSKLILTSISKMLYMAERMSFKMAKINTSVFEEKIIANYYRVSADKCIKIPNGFNESSSIANVGLQVMKSVHRRWEEENINTKKNLKIVYSGSVSKSIDLEAFVRALLKEIKENESKIELHILTPYGGSKYRHLSEQVIVVEGLSSQEIFEYYKNMDIGLAKTNNSKVFRYGVSLTKYTDYMICGLPVLDLVNCVKTPITQSGSGIHAKPTTELEIRNALRNITKLSKKDLDALSVKGREWALKNLNMTISTNNLMKKIINENE